MLNNVEHCEEHQRPFLNKEYVLDILWRQILMEGENQVLHEEQLLFVDVHLGAAVMTELDSIL